MAGTFLRIFAPFVRITPEIKQTDREISFKDKLIYTFIVLGIYILMSVIPLYGLPGDDSGIDNYYWLRVIMASSKGTLTELGIGPLVTAGLIMQLLQGSKMIKVNMSDPDDRALFTGAQKVLGIFLTIVQAIAYLLGNYFGDFEGNIGNQILVFLQLLAAGMVVMLLDEILQKGYGLGSGISLFIASGVAGSIFWAAFSFMNSGSADGLSNGIMIAIFEVLFGNRVFPDTHTLFPGEPISFGYLFLRSGGQSSILGLITTLLIFFGVIYVETIRVEIPLTHSGYKGYRGKYPMKLLYVSNIPVILAQALYANFMFIGQLLWNAVKDKAVGDPWRVIVGIFGTYEEVEGQQYMKPVGGILKFLTPPTGLQNMIETIQGDSGAVGGIVLQSVIYLIVFILICVVFGKIWIEVSGLAPRDIASQILNSKMQIPGFRSSEKIVEKILKRYIPTLTILCGIIVGLLSFTADFLGALTSGTGLLLTVGIIQNYSETIAKEAYSADMPGLSNLLG